MKRSHVGISRTIKWGAREGRHVWKHTITRSPLGFVPKVYSRLVRVPYTGEELRALRAERGVGIRKGSKR